VMNPLRLYNLNIKSDDNDLYHVLNYSHRFAKMKLLNTMQAYPIRGKRYKCKDCTELIGFDLCEACYNSSSKLPGRFNQQHTPDHRMELDNSALLQRFLRFPPEEGQQELMMEEAVVVPGAMLELVFDNQGMAGNDGGPGDAAMGEAVGAPGDMLHIIIDDQEGMGDNGEEDQEA